MVPGLPFARPHELDCDINLAQPAFGLPLERVLLVHRARFAKVDWLVGPGGSDLFRLEIGDGHQLREFVWSFSKLVDELLHLRVTHQPRPWSSGFVPRILLHIF